MNIRKATWNSKILMNKSKDRDSNFLVVQSKSLKSYWERRDDSLMLATIRDDTWNVLNMQHIISKFEKMGLFRHPRWWP